MVLSEKVYRFISKYESRFIYTVYMHVHVSRVMVEFGIQKKKKRSWRILCSMHTLEGISNGNEIIYVTDSCNFNVDSYE